MRWRQHWPSASDADLIRGVRDGDAAAFEELHSRFRVPVTRQASRILGSRHPSLDDVVQDVFCRTLLALRGVDEDRMRLLPWLMRVTHNRCMDELRAARPEPLAPEVVDSVCTPAAGVVTAIAARQTLRETVADIHALPPRQRDALLAIVVHGRSHRELAKEMQASVPASKALVNRARAELIALRAVRAAAERRAA